MIIFNLWNFLFAILNFFFVGLSSYQSAFIRFCFNWLIFIELPHSFVLFLLISYAFFGFNSISFCSSYVNYACVTSTMMADSSLFSFEWICSYWGLNLIFSGRILTVIEIFMKAPCNKFIIFSKSYKATSGSTSNLNPDGL